MKRSHPYPVDMPASRWKDIGGQRFGRLTALQPTGTKRHGQHVWICRCDCGGYKSVPIGSLQAAAGTKSCGCDLYDGARNIKHGMSDTPIYNRWRSMLRRCYEPTNKAYKYYGGRGITVCERWHEFKNFYADMGLPPTPKHQVDRIDSDKGYCPENCRWLTGADNLRKAMVEKKARGFSR